jgi:paraquat-inducible protein B
MNEADSPYDQLEVDQKKRISSIWIIPLIALLFGGYLAVKAYMERGIFITVHFDTAKGIVAGKTEVRYKGLPAGLVKKIQLDKDLQSVSVDIEMVKRTEALLTEDTLFWLVQPEVSLSGVSGLETLTGGNYIGFRPGLKKDSPRMDEFTALSAPPPIPTSTPGLHIVLKADRKGSVKAGTKVYYRQIAVGEVTSVGLDELKSGVTFTVHIREEHEDLVSNTTRFWNASGITFNGNLSGLKLRTESLESMLVGGIAFDNIDQTEAAKTATRKSEFVLYEDFDAAQVGLPITLKLPYGSGIAEGTEIVFEGLKAGKVLNFTINAETRQIIANATIDPRGEQILNENTQFYMVSPKASLSGIANLDTLIKGRYIGIRPATTGSSAREFEVLPEAPPLGYEYPGLHINLVSRKADGLSQGDPISFQKIQVGTIQQVRPTESGNFVIAAHIVPEYVHLIDSNTRFWNAGGIRFKGSLQRFEIETDSLVSMLSGGVAFGQVGELNKTGSRVANGTEFRLYRDRDDALFSHIVQITFPTAKGIVPELTPVNYNGVTVGKVKSLRVDPRLSEVTASIGFNPKFSWSLRANTQFWLVNPAFSEEGLNAMLSGTYITMVPGSGDYSTNFRADVNAPVADPSAPGLQFVIQSRQAGSVTRGSGIFYQQLRVGEIQDVRLNKTRGGVDIYAQVGEKYADLIKNGSRFYRASGITLKGDISGFKLQTESLSALLSGGIAFYTPEEELQGPVGQDRAIYKLYDDFAAADAAGIDIRIRFNNAKGLRINMPVKFQDQEVGVVNDIQFDADLSGVTLYATLNHHAIQYARADSRFWLEKPEVGLTKIKNVQTIVTGTYLAISPGKGEVTRDFTGLDYPPVVKTLRQGLNLVLTSSRPGSIKVGDAVSYRQIKVGEIIGIDLAPDANGVLIYINIYPRYQSLVRSDSVFWNASGIKVAAGLFSGVKIDTESVEALLSGGVAFASPAASSGQKLADQSDRYQLHDEVNEEWLNWRPDIRLSDSN